METKNTGWYKDTETEKWKFKHPEVEYVHAFMRATLRKAPGARVSVREVFKAYSSYYLGETSHRTKLNVIGFGKIFRKKMKTPQKIMRFGKKLLSAVPDYTLL